MNENLTANEIGLAVREFAADRYQFLDDDSVIIKFQKFCPVDIDNQVIRIKRIGNEDALPRTLLITVLNNISEITKALKWAATVKDNLVNPESSDLYLFLGFKNDELSIEQAAKYESNDLFCRKFILRSGETIKDLIGRTFVKDLNSEGDTEEFNDPLYSALLATSAKHDWLTKDKINNWRTVFLSGRTGSELIDAIINNQEISGSNDAS